MGRQIKSMDKVCWGIRTLLQGLGLELDSFIWRPIPLSFYMQSYSTTCNFSSSSSLQQQLFILLGSWIMMKDSREVHWRSFYCQEEEHAFEEKPFAPKRSATVSIRTTCMRMWILEIITQGKPQIKQHNDMWLLVLFKYYRLSGTHHHMVIQLGFFAFFNIILYLRSNGSLFNAGAMLG